MKRISEHFSAHAKGFSLPELLVIVVILGVTAAVGIPAFFFLVQRARVQSVALEVAGGIENVRNVAANVDSNSNSRDIGGCRLTFVQSSSQAGQAVASTDCTNTTLPGGEIRIPDIQGDSVALSIEQGTSPIYFTPRGLWTQTAGSTTAGGTPGAGFKLKITLSGGGPSRCVRISPVLGSVDIGRPSGGNSDSCSDASAEWQTI
ncbi:hypothetical protein KBY96_02120 [Cyanobium sp. ATX 6A2]|nr:hypothetical protein [Cyanobium sp. ATX 6A2]